MAKPWKSRRRQRREHARALEEQAVKRHREQGDEYADLRVYLTGEHQYRDFFLQEYETLRQDSRISDLQLGNNIVSCKAHITITLGHTTYFLGDFLVVVCDLIPDDLRPPDTAPTPECPWWYVRLLNSGNVKSAHPLYAMQNAHHFCFGHHRTEYLRELHRKGEIYQLIQTVLDSLGHLNGNFDQKINLLQDYRQERWHERRR